jgi:hypothetical protein
MQLSSSSCRFLMLRSEVSSLRVRSSQRITSHLRQRLPSMLTENSIHYNLIYTECFGALVQYIKRLLWRLVIAENVNKCF